MERKEAIDWLYRLKSDVQVYLPKGLQIKFTEALDLAIVSLETDEAYQLEHEKPRGKWLYDEDRGATGVYAICSECNELVYQTGEFKYCPNCGAKMVEPQESEEV